MTSCVFFLGFPGQIWTTSSTRYPLPSSSVACLAKGSWKHYTTLFWGVGGEYAI